MCKIKPAMTILKGGYKPTFKFITIKPKHLNGSHLKPEMYDKIAKYENKNIILLIEDGIKKLQLHGIKGINRVATPKKSTVLFNNCNISTLKTEGNTIFDNSTTVTNIFASKNSKLKFYNSFCTTLLKKVKSVTTDGLSFVKGKMPKQLEQKGRSTFLTA